MSKFRQVLKNHDITKREIIASIIIIVIMISFGIVISNYFQNLITSNNEKYFKAAKIENDEELFDYAIRTEVGRVLVYGTAKANQPVTYPILDGEYFSVIRVTERKVEEVRYVPTPDGGMLVTDYVWKEEKVESKNTETFTFLGQELTFNDFEFNDYDYLGTFNQSANLRYKYYGLPTKFDMTLYSVVRGGQLSENVVFENKTIDEVMKNAENSHTIFSIFFWLFWFVIIIFVLFIFYLSENRYLNGKIK